MPAAAAAPPELVRLRLYEMRKRHELGLPLSSIAATFQSYQFEPERYIREKLGWEPWAGDSESQPGQMEVLHAYALALRQQHERDAYEKGQVSLDELTCWHPDMLIQNWLRVEAGHSIGKTKLSAGIVNHFFDCFPPSIIYSFAPTKQQIHDLLWKEIKADRRDKALPGRILDLELRRADNHFAIGRATNNATGTGTERIQGQHGKYLLFVLDEAEGIANYVYDAVKSMTSGGISIVLLLANPRTRSSRFHQAATLPHVRSFRISCTWHPNVLSGREIVPSAVRRDYVESLVVEHCAVVDEPDEDANTFTLPFDVRTTDGALPAGTIFRPDPEMLFRGLGIAPANIADNTLVPLGRYEAAINREPTVDRPTMARMGVDVARYGKDFGTVYVRHNGAVWRAAHLYHLDTFEYARVITEEAHRLRALGVTSLRIRVDGGGGFGDGVIDHLNHDLQLVEAFRDFAVIRVHFGGRPYDTGAYANVTTEMHAAAAEALKVLAIREASPLLEGDLCDRTYDWMSYEGVAVKRLEHKDAFKKRMGRSPDDGDGFVMAVAPDEIFGDVVPEALPDFADFERTSPWRM
ncbi:MAG: hypothetical protein KGL39_22640 [Patescibacteria group bacterium]|nr:hypothetical protein [Patescibacteria group bacterium]